MRPSKTKALRKPGPPQEAGQSGTITSSRKNFSFILEGAGETELDGERRTVGPGDAILIPPGAWHTIIATEPLRFLCCCAPPYAHEATYLE
jgi:mannose-6-phosphate isomerase-like protein (cupin superfamily)